MIILYVTTELARSWGPLKNKEYLACAQLVISAALSQAAASQFVHVAKRRNAFVKDVVSAAEGRRSCGKPYARRFIEAES